MPPSKKRLISAEDLYRLAQISDVRLSPDGTLVVYTAQRIDRKTEKKYHNLWVVSTENGGERQFTHGDQNDTHPRWSPDGSQIAFLSNRGDKEKPSQIYLIPVAGGEARCLTAIQGEIGGFVWSPDGRQLVCTIRKLDPEEIERQENEEKQKLGVVERHYDRVFYKLDDYGYLHKERWHLWSIDTRTGRAKQLTDHATYDEGNPAWSPDGKWIAFLSNRSDNPDFDPDAVDLFVMPSSGGDFRRIPTPAGDKALPSFSPNGRWIAYYSIEGKYQWYRNQGLCIVPADGSQPALNLTEKFDRHVSAWTINDVGQPELMPPTWSKDSQTLFFPVVFHGSSMLVSTSIQGDNLQELIGEGGVVGSFSFDRDQEHMAYFYGKMDNPCQIHLREMETGKTRQLTRLNPMLRNVDLGEVETVWFKGREGNDLQGWILKPPGFDPKQKYPSILYIHGGPLTQYGYFFMHEFYFHAANGYVVYFSNPRGGRGYGEKHGMAIWGDWGNKDYIDLMDWTDYISKLPYIDTGRMGVTGGSYGGYMTIWIIGHTDRFQAAVTQRCVSNFISEWGASDFNWTFQIELQTGAPFQDLEKYWDMSPMKYIGNAKTPTLVLHNENDMRCSIEQSEQVFVALKSLGVDSEMVRFPDEFHGLSRTGRTDRRIARLNHIKRWFDKYLK